MAVHELLRTEEAGSVPTFAENTSKNDHACVE